jgi:excinuclease UvrABC helicase subunit UvrB
MREAAKNLEFEKAALYRDEILKMKKKRQRRGSRLK